MIKFGKQLNSSTDVEKEKDRIRGVSYYWNLFVPLFMICFIDAKLSANTYFYAHKPIINQTRIFRTSALLSLYIDEFLLVFFINEWFRN